jgi:hypothetical protein
VRAYKAPDNRVLDFMLFCDMVQNKFIEQYGKGITLTLEPVTFGFFVKAVYDDLYPLTISGDKT